ncbi:MAG: carbon storage regulator [Actinomycetota bacterium]|nr:carbon storage regulator [Actinomycetota bacterium]
MLVLTRSRGDRIVIGDDVTVTLLSVGRSRCSCGARQDGVRVQLGVEAPRDLRVLRGEVYDAVAASNLASAGTDALAGAAVVLGSHGGLSPAIRQAH